MTDGRAPSEPGGIHASAQVHPTALVDDGATVGANTRIWHFVHVSAGAVIGAGCVLGQNVFVAPGVRIGAGCRIQNNVSVYTGVELEDEVFVGPSAVFTNVVNPRAHVSRKDAFAPTRVCRRATIGANATIVCGVTLGEGAFVGAGSVVTRDVAPRVQVQGNPARPAGWRCDCGEPAVAGSGGAVCQSCGTRYRVRSDGGLDPEVASATDRAEG
ncbi:MAG: DapH/DapD/GlmU-related protein [Planctomycetota bacterium]|nr:DapH/DapD/GlmU-related protein [Planctomycetota bacterium]